jgi:uncharacterized protein (TIGR00290 family)
VTRESVVFSWSGGKDSAVGLHVLGVRRTLLARQAEALDIPLVEVRIPARCTDEMYQVAIVTAITTPPLETIDTHAFADLFLEDVRSYRETNLAKLGKKPIFPIWGRDTSQLAREFIELGFRGIVVCVDTKSLSPEFAGREFDAAFLDALPQGVDPCGENGEFHTFVYDGPIFHSRIDLDQGETVVRDGFAFKDLVEQ